ncbi:unnamed protein product, partial [Musa banksii]
MDRDVVAVSHILLRGVLSIAVSTPVQCVCVESNPRTLEDAPDQVRRTCRRAP